MKYEVYEKSLIGCIREVNYAVKKGLVLTRLENFDYLFKRELAIIGGARLRGNFIQKAVKHLLDSDYRLAKFYAKGFREIVKIHEEGYSFSKVRVQLKNLIKEAKSNHIYSGGMKLTVSDKNGVISVDISKVMDDKVSFLIKNTEDYINTYMFIVSEIGCFDETSPSYRKWFKNYLETELLKVIFGGKAEVFVESQRVVEDFYHYSGLKKTEKAKTTKAKAVKKETKGKVVAFNKKCAGYR